MLGQAALVGSALFTGAAIYVSFAEQPARMTLDDRSALAQWKPSYARATIMQAALVLVTTLLGIAAWYRYQSNWPWLAGSIVILLNLPYTFGIIMPLNNRLKAVPLDEASGETRAMLVRWNQLHFWRNVLGVTATALFYYGLIDPV